MSGDKGNDASDFLGFTKEIKSATSKHSLGIRNGWPSTTLPPTRATSFSALICLTSHCRHMLSDRQIRTHGWEDAQQNNSHCAQETIFQSLLLNSKSLNTLIFLPAFQIKPSLSPIKSFSQMHLWYFFFKKK